jgi:hypothetical protein
LNEYFVLAFIVTPLAAVTLGWAAVFFHERTMRRNDSSAPAE